MVVVLIVRFIYVCDQNNRNGSLGRPFASCQGCECEQVCLSHRRQGARERSVHKMIGNGYGGDGDGSSDGICTERR